MKNILLTSLLIATSNAYSHDVDYDIIELDDFQETNQSGFIYSNDENETENIEARLKKHWEKNSYTKKGKQFIDNEYN